MHFYIYKEHFNQVWWNFLCKIQFLKSCPIVSNSWENPLIQITASLQKTELAGFSSQGSGTIVLLPEHWWDGGLTDVKRSDRWVPKISPGMGHLWKDPGKADSGLRSLQTASLPRKYSFHGVSLGYFFWVNKHRILDMNCISRKLRKNVPM